MNKLQEMLSMVALLSSGLDDHPGQLDVYEPRQRPRDREVPNPAVQLRAAQKRLRRQLKRASAAAREGIERDLELLKRALEQLEA